MSIASELVTKVRELGATVEVTSDRLKLRGPRPLPDDLVAELRDNKPAIMRHLGQQAIEPLQRRYQQVFSGDGPGDAELTEIMRRVYEEGYVLCWSEDRKSVV